MQVVRTYPVKRPPYPFAPQGERSIARLYERAIERARSLIYIEDQYFWSEDIARRFEKALREVPTLRLLVVVPRHPDRDGALSGPANRVGQLQMMERLFRVGGDRVAVYDLENERGDAIYVHAKVVLIDDVFAMIGSDNLNRRSWTHDSELSIAVVDEGSTPTFARDLRIQLWREHLAEPLDTNLLEFESGFDLWRARAVALDRWHGCASPGDRPLGRARIHRPRRVARWQRAWAGVLYRTIVDPDGRPRALRRSHGF